MKLTTPHILWNRKSIVFFVLINLLQPLIFAQQRLPVIKASAKQADIRDGEVFQKGIWNLSPEVKPDIYNALPPFIDKRITFYTDIDSISFDVRQDHIYEFIILLNNKDTCYTQISTIKPVKVNEVNTVLSPPIVPKSLHEDFDAFRKALEKEHAGLYRYRSKKEMDKLFNKYQTRLNEPMQQLEFAKIVMNTVSYIQDGHTGTNIPRLLMEYYNEQRKVFPYSLYFSANRAYVLCSTEHGLSIGSEIISIDGKTIIDIEKELFKYLASDGSIETKKREQLNGGAFPVLHNWIYGEKGSFTIEYRTQNGNVEKAVFEGRLLKDFDCNYKNNNNVKALQLDFPQTDVALLTIKSFDDNRLNKDFKNFLKTSFQEIETRKIKNLIIDVRDNAGGSEDYGVLLYSYIARRPFKYYLSKASTTHQQTIQENPYLGTQKTQENSYKGNVLFLINGLSFSTTAEFCAIARSNDRGRFIGEETGGGYYGNNSGQTTNITLPNSKIRITIPLFAYVNDVKKAKYKDRGVIPDFQISPTINQLMQHIDAQLNFALKLIDLP